MKTQKTNKLAYNKHSIVELDSGQLSSVRGGNPTSPIVTTSIPCTAVGVAVTVAEQVFEAGEAVGGMISRLFK